MAVNLQVLFGGAFFIFSVALWGAYGFLILLLQFLSSPRTFFQQKDHSALPDKAGDPSLGVQNKVLLKSQVRMYLYSTNYDHVHCCNYYYTI